MIVCMICDSSAYPRVVIVGGGLAGLVLALALALEKHLNIKALVFDQAPGFDDNVGGAIGMYPNGLRVLKNISPKLLKKVRSEGNPYVYRRWMRHDGYIVTEASESILEEDENLQSIGILRWKLQKVLYEEAIGAGIKFLFGKRLKLIKVVKSGSHDLEFHDGSSWEADIVFGADGVNSAVRSNLFPEVDLKFTGVTCLMGTSDISRDAGICFPSSSTTKCHGCFYPISDSSQVFQLYFPSEEKPETWGKLSEQEAADVCLDLANLMYSDGWDSQFIDPIKNAKNVIRVGLRWRSSLSQWVKGKCILLGDAAHPALPYIGQGAMMAFEDAGIIVELLRLYCLKSDGSLDFKNFDECMKIYEEIRIPRTINVFGNSKSLGIMQQRRASSWLSKIINEVSLQTQIILYGHLSSIIYCVSYKYDESLKDYLQKYK